MLKKIGVVFRKTALPAVCAASLIVGVAEPALAADGVAAAKYVSSSSVSTVLMDDVTNEMTDYTYWTGLLDDASSVLTDNAEIASINEGNVKADGTSMVDIASYNKVAIGAALKSSAQKEAISEYVGEYGSPKNYYSGSTSTRIYDEYYDSSGTVNTSSAMYQAIDNCQAASDLTAVQYAVPVRYTTVDFLPSDIKIYDDYTDPDFDYQYLSGLRINEPVVIRAYSKDGNWCYVQSSMIFGWVEKADLAIFSSKDAWLASWNTAEDKTLVVYGYKVYTEDSYYDTSTANIALTMGTTLPVESATAVTDQVTNRATYYNYVVTLPTRDSNGNYVGAKALITSRDEVSIGYLLPTQENIAKVAFGMLGKRYGWGGMLSSDDCSQYLRNVYACFGINLPRNTSWQQKAAVFGYDVSEYTDEQKLELLDHMPLGTILYFSGHAMMYLGQSGGKYYVISSVSTMKPVSLSSKQRIRSVVINTLDTQRANGKTWLSSLITYKVPWRYKDYSAANATTDSAAGDKKDASGFVVSLSENSYTYDGTSKQPSIKVTDTAGNVISSRYYNVTWDADTVSVGDHTIGLSFGWLYSGTVTCGYSIVEKPVETTTLSKPKITKAKAKKKAILLKWKKASQVTGYQIQYSTNKKFSRPVTLTISKASKTSYTIKKLTAKKKYYVRIRTYLKKGGAYYYSSWSAKKAVKTKK